MRSYFVLAAHHSSCVFHVHFSAIDLPLMAPAPSSTGDPAVGSMLLSLRRIFATSTTEGISLTILFYTSLSLVLFAWCAMYARLSPSASGL